MSERLVREMRIARGAVSGDPILLLPDGFAYLSGKHINVGRFVTWAQGGSMLQHNSDYDKPLTDEEEALAMKLILLYG